MSFKKPKRFWSKVDIRSPNECWEWLAGKSRKGYGRFQIHNKPWRTHRVAWILTYGPIPEGLYALHKCDNPGCVNPYHLFLGTQTDNMSDAARKGRMSRGVDRYSAKLTEEEVLDIREWYAEGGWTQQELADAFGVSRAHISRITSKGKWAWL